MTVCLNKSDASLTIEFERVRDWLETELESRMLPLRNYAADIASLAVPATTRGLGSACLTAAAVEGLISTSEALIEHFPTTIGAGFIAEPMAVDLRTGYIFWLQQANGAIRRLRLNYGSSDVDSYDYTYMDWYVRTRDLGQPSLTGPFLDYSGSDALVLTLASPVTAHNEFVGVVAIDIAAEVEENAMTKQLCTLPVEAVLVNRDRTIVATNSVRWMPGERMSAMPSENLRHFHHVASITDWAQWQLAVGCPQTG